MSQKVEERQMAIRDDSGRFIAGNPGGPGRKPVATERLYLRALAAVVTLEQWTKVVEKALAQAQAGDRHAREWISKYLVPAHLSLSMTLSRAEFADAYPAEIVGDLNLLGDPDTDLECRGLQPHLLSQEDRVVALALVRAMARTEATAKSAEPEGPAPNLLRG